MRSTSTYSPEALLIVFGGSFWLDMVRWDIAASWMVCVVLSCTYLIRAWNMPI